MTAFDYALLFLLGCSVILGTKRGVVREVLSLGSWAAAFFVANMYAKELALMLPEALGAEYLRLIAAFIILLIAVRIAVMLLIRTTDVLIGAGGLSGLNRMLGSLFGLARGVLLALVLVLLCGMTSIPQEPFWKNARFSPYAEEAAVKVMAYLPEGIAKSINY